MTDRRPSFASEFPRTPQLDALVDAFAHGNYERVRADAAKVCGSTEDQAVKRAARALVERTVADPLAKWLLAMAAALLVAMTAWWVAHGKPPPAGSTAPGTPPIERVR